MIVIWKFSCNRVNSYCICCNVNEDIRLVAFLSNLNDEEIM